MKILVLGASGMIGSAMLRVLGERDDWEVIGAVRSESARAHFSTPVAERMVCGTDLLAGDMLARLFATTRPDVVVNCAGLTKHLPAGNEPLPAIARIACLREPGVTTRRRISPMQPTSTADPRRLARLVGRAW